MRKETINVFEADELTGSGKERMLREHAEFLQGIKTPEELSLYTEEMQIEELKANGLEFTSNGEIWKG